MVTGIISVLQYKILEDFGFELRLPILFDTMSNFLKECL